MQVITLDGPAKTGKTCIGEAMTAALSAEYEVRYGVAGHFFRKVTAAVLEELNGDMPNENGLNFAIDHVVGKSIAYDETKVWGNLERPEINANVAEVARRDIVQQAGLDWYETFADQALHQGVEVLVVDGRNPRDRMRSWLGSNSLSPSLDLFVTCDVKEAARRSLLARGKQPGDPRLLSRESASLAHRRRIDMTRTVFPFVKPVDVVPFMPENMCFSSNVVAAQVGNGTGAELPKPILFETTHMPKSDMTASAIGLAQAALRYETVIQSNAATGLVH